MSHNPNPIQVPREAYLVYLAILEWEFEQGQDFFTSFFDYEETAIMLMRVVEAMKKDNPPSVDDNEGFALFILNVYVEFAQDFGINGIKGFLNTPHRQNIAADAAATIVLAESEWPANPWFDAQVVINELLALDIHFPIP